MNVGDMVVRITAEKMRPVNGDALLNSTLQTLQDRLKENFDAHGLTLRLRPSHCWQTLVEVTA